MPRTGDRGTTTCETAATSQIISRNMARQLRLSECETAGAAGLADVDFYVALRAGFLPDFSCGGFGFGFAFVGVGFPGGFETFADFFIGLLLRTLRVDAAAGITWFAADRADFGTRGAQDGCGLLCTHNSDRTFSRAGLLSRGRVGVG
jgi:hypothetical protein